MPLAQQFTAGIILIGVITVLFLPGRQTVAGINAITNFTTQTLGTAMGTK
jgi:hypothetical protein